MSAVAAGAAAAADPHHPNEARAALSTSPEHQQQAHDPLWPESTGHSPQSAAINAHPNQWPARYPAPPATNDRFSQSARPESSTKDGGAPVQVQGGGAPPRHWYANPSAPPGYAPAHHHHPSPYGFATYPHAYHGGAPPPPPSDVPGAPGQPNGQPAADAYARAPPQRAPASGASPQPGTPGYPWPGYAAAAGTPHAWPGCPAYDARYYAPAGGWYPPPPAAPHAAAGGHGTPGSVAPPSPRSAHGDSERDPAAPPSAEGGASSFPSRPPSLPSSTRFTRNADHRARHAAAPYSAPAPRAAAAHGASPAYPLPRPQHVPGNSQAPHWHHHHHPAADPYAPSPRWIPGPPSAAQYPGTARPPAPPGYAAYPQQQQLHQHTMPPRSAYAPPQGPAAGAVPLSAVVAPRPPAPLPLEQAAGAAPVPPLPERIAHRGNFWQQQPPCADSAGNASAGNASAGSAGAPGDAERGSAYGMGHLDMDDEDDDFDEKQPQRQYFVFNRLTYELMVRALRADMNLPQLPERDPEETGPYISEPYDLSQAQRPAGMHRKKWIRLKSRLRYNENLHARRCLSWKNDPLIIAPEEDWNDMILKAHVKANGQHISLKQTYLAMRKEFQTRRSRCGIPYERIAEFVAACDYCKSMRSEEHILATAAASAGVAVATARSASSSSSLPHAGQVRQGSMDAASGAGSAPGSSADVGVSESAASPISVRSAA